MATIVMYRVCVTTQANQATPRGSTSKNTGGLCLLLNGN